MDDEPVATFIAESRAVGTGVRRVDPAGLTNILVELLAGGGTVVVAAGLEEIAEKLRACGVAAVAEVTGGEAAEALPVAEAGLCRALAAVADSGTVLLGPGSGLEGAISILPPHCVVVLARDVIYPDLASALAVAAPLFARPGARLVFVTGPSRTSDIELTPVIGVHGPLRLDVVIVDG